MPKAKTAPKPVEFSISQLLVGRCRWVAGGSGPNVQLSMMGRTAQRPRKQVILVGKVLFGRGRFAFEVQDVDYSPAEIKKLIAKEKQIEEERFGGYGYDDYQQVDRGCPDWLEMFKAQELAPKHSLQIKFDDIVRIDTAGDAITFHLSSTAACYIKPAGETSRGNMEVSKDITGGAKTFVFFTDVPPPDPTHMRSDKPVLAFSKVQEMLMEQSPRLAALFQGLPPPVTEVVATPKGKKRPGDGDEDLLLASSQKRSARGPVGSGAVALKFEKVSAEEGTWLKRAVDRFGLTTPLNEQISEAEWQKYYKDREAWEESNKKSDNEEEEDDEDPFNEREESSVTEIIEQIQKSVRDTLSSTSLTLDPKIVARGAVLTSWDSNDADEGEPRTASSKAIFYSPVANGRHIELIYENHCRVRQSFTERDSYMWVRKGGIGFEIERDDNEPRNVSRRTQFQRAGFEKLFELDYNEFRKKNQVKTTVATNATLSGIGMHLFGAEGVLSNRKVFGLLVRCAGLGQFKENNGWPIAVMRRRFKCAKGEKDTDTEKISGEADEDPSMGGGCCVM